MAARAYPELISLDGFPFRVLVSPGSEERGRHLATRAAAALDWLGQVTGKVRQPDLVIADEDDWPKVCEIPVYGMPFSLPDKLATSPTPGSMWQEYLNVLVPHLSQSASTEIATALGDPPDFTELADLILTHEATHVFHDIHPVTETSEFPALWVMELFANLGMHGYLATHEPEQLRRLAVVAEATIDAGHEVWAVQDLSLMGESLSDGVTNYLWYEFRLISLAAQLWDAGGADGLRDYQRLLGHPDLSPGDVIDRFDQIAPAVAAAIRRWPAA